MTSTEGQAFKLFDWKRGRKLRGMEDDDEYIGYLLHSALAHPKWASPSFIFLPYGDCSYQGRSRHANGRRALRAWSDLLFIRPRSGTRRTSGMDLLIEILDSAHGEGGVANHDFEFAWSLPHPATVIRYRL